MGMFRPMKYCISPAPQPPLHPPGHVNAIWTNGLIQVTWEAPPHPAYLTPILGYKLNWGEGDGPLPQSGLSSKPASVRSVSIATSNLLSSYTVAVWAYSRAGDGPMGVATLQPQSKYLLVVGEVLVVFLLLSHLPPSPSPSFPTSLPTSLLHISSPLPPNLPIVTSPYVITSCDSTSSEAANVQWKVKCALIRGGYLNHNGWT